MQLSVIVPAYRAARTLDACLHALVANTMARSAWQLLVVDDGSDDDTAVIAGRYADRVLRVDGGPLGPAHARNVAAAVATAPVLVFIDADVVSAPDVLQRFADRLAPASGVDAVLGTYDDRPADPGFVSQYRNLLHHHVHMVGAGRVDTFWAGCGAVRRAAFLDAGGFDALRYRTPQVEDIELGYRLSERGCRVELDPAIQCSHLKRWSLSAMLRTDYVSRAVPWMELLLERRQAFADGSLNVGKKEKWLVALTGMSLLLLVASLVLRSWACAVEAVALLSLTLLVEAPLLRWFVQVRGGMFAARVAPMRLAFHVVCGVAAIRVLVAPPRRTTTRDRAQALPVHRARSEPTPEPTP